MAERGGHVCYHCKEWVEAGAPHDCWTTTEAALTRDLSQDLADAWERLRDSAADLGEQRIYASHKSIMFARRSCYFFVRPKKSALEVCFFLRRALQHPRIRRTDQVSAAKVAHTVHVKHRDEVEAPLTDWLREAYETSALPAPAKSIAKKSSARDPTARRRGSATKNVKPRKPLKTRPKTSPTKRR